MSAWACRRRVTSFIPYTGLDKLSLTSFQAYTLLAIKIKGLPFIKEDPIRLKLAALWLFFNEFFSSNYSIFAIYYLRQQVNTVISPFIILTGTILYFAFKKISWPAFFKGWKYYPENYRCIEWKPVYQFTWSGAGRRSINKRTRKIAGHSF